MDVTIGTARIVLLQGDITEQETDAVINAANPTLMGGGGVDGAIHRRGGPEVLRECRIVRETIFPGGLPTGEAVATTGGELRVKWIIHTVGPVWSGGGNGESEQLAKSYRNCLVLAKKMRLKKVSFPSISTGAYGYPVERASRVALGTVMGFLRENAEIEEVRFVLHSQHDLAIYETALAGLGDTCGT